MRRFLLPLAVIGLPSCNTVAFNAVLIRPIYGYVDGCTSVKISGSAFGDDTTVSVDMEGQTADVGGITQASDDPTVESDRLKALNDGFYVTGVMPPAPSGQNGYASVVVSTGGATDTMTEAYYYVACPTPGYFETYGPSEGVAAGSDVALQGCSLDPATMQVVLYTNTGTGVGQPVAEVPLVSDCGTAQVHFTAPDVPDGTYVLAVTDLDGNVLYGGECLPADTADTAYYCVESYVIYGAGSTTTQTDTGGTP